MSQSHIVLPLGGGKMRRRDARGFSVVELIVVVGIIAVLSTFAVVQIGTILSNGRVDSAFQITIQQLRFARQIHIDNRQIIVVTFTAPQTITVQQWPRSVAGGCSYGVPVNNFDYDVAMGYQIST